MNSLKKNLCKYMTIFFLALLVVGLYAQPAEAAVKLNHTGLSLCVGDTYKLQLTGTAKKAKWKSSKPKVVKVSSTGTVRALKSGSATVTATLNKKSYSCKIKVNKTFKVEQTSVSIKKNTEVRAYLSVNGSIFSAVEDKKICSVTFGKWDGDYMPLTITPKAVGTTNVTLTNSVNGESCVLKVKVTGVPVNASFQEPTVSTGAENFIAGENSMSFKFSLDRAASTVNFKIYDASGDVVRNIKVGALKASKTKSVTWDGMDESGDPMEGTFTYGVVADGTKTVGGTGSVLDASPFGKGDGTAANPFLVSDRTEFALIKSYNGCYFAQDADIDFDMDLNYSSALPLFSDSNPFTGTYDGKYENKSYRLLNLYGYTSVFGSIGKKGTVKNVTMSNCVLNISGSLLAFTNSGTIDGCTIGGTIRCNESSQAAMMVMYNKGTIRDCKVSGNVTVSMSKVSSATTLKAGGIVLNNTGMIAQCTSSVTLKVQMDIGTYVANTAYELYTGGVVAENASDAFVTQCTFTGSITPAVNLPENLKDTPNITAGNIYSGFVAGSSYGYIEKCINASSDKNLGAQGTGTGDVQ